MKLSQLFRPKWKSSVPSKLKAAIDKLSDQRILAYIAENDKDRSVRKAAVEKITDQQILAKIQENDDDINMRIAAVDRLIDQTVLTMLRRRTVALRTKCILIKVLILL